MVLLFLNNFTFILLEKFIFYYNTGLLPFLEIFFIVIAFMRNATQGYILDIIDKGIFVLPKKPDCKDD